MDKLKPRKPMHNMLYLAIASAVQVSGFLLRVIFRIGG